MERKELSTAAELILRNLVSGMYANDIDYVVSFEKHDDTQEEYCVVDVIIDSETYWKIMDEHNYLDNYQFEFEISEDIKNSLKYLGITRCIVELLVDDNGVVGIRD